MTEGVTCGELFDTLLALDHSRRQPWGGVHGEVVACYFLQHPGAPRAPAETAPLYEILERFAARGLPPSVTTAETSTAVTIHDVAVDGSFPAAGHRERVQRWAAAILAGRPPSGGSR